MTYSYPTGSFQTRYETEFEAAFPGLFQSIIENPLELGNVGADANQVITVEVGTATNSTAYTLTLSGTSVTYTSDGTATTTEIRDGLLNAIKADGFIYSLVSAAIVDADTFTLTARIPGVTLVFSTSGGGSGYAASTTTAAAASGDIPYGRMVARKTTDPVGSCRLPTASGDILLGVSGGSGMTQYFSGSRLIYPRASSVTALRKGEVWAEVEEAITYGAPAYYRHTVDSTLNQLGIFADSAGTGKTLIANGAAVFVTTDITLSSGIRIARLSINLP